MEERACIKCGRQIGADESVCGVCNRAGMATPSASQYHGTVAAAIVLAVGALAIAGSLAVRGVGPYAAEVLAWQATAEAGLEVRLAVDNEGSQSGRAKCRIVALDDAGRTLRVRNVLSPAIAGGGREVFTERVPGLATSPSEVTAACQ